MKTPESPRARKLRAVLLSLVACAAFLAAACSDPQQAKLEHVARGETFLKERRYQEAVIEFRNAVQIDDNLAAAHWGLAQAYEALGRAGEWFEELQRTVKLDPNNYVARLKLANGYLLAYSQNKNQEFLAQAEQLAREILARDDRNIDGRVLAANVLYFQDPQKNAAEAERRIKEAITLDPQRVETHVGLAKFYLLNKREADAEAAYRRAVEVNDRSSLAHVEYGKFLVQTNRVAQAEAEFSRAAEVDPNNRDVRWVLASFYLLNRPEKAEEAYTAWARLDWDRPEGRARLADYYATVGRFDDAANLYQEIVKSAPDYSRGRYRLGEISLQRGDIAGAEAQSVELLKANQRDADALFLRGRTRLAANKLKEAIADFKSVLEQDPRSRLGLYYMADALYRDGQFEQARTHVGEIERYHPDFLPARLLQVQINLDSGDAEAANRLADELLKRLDQTAPGGEQTPQILAEVKTNAILLRSKASLRRGQQEPAASARHFAAARSDGERARAAAPNSPVVHVNLGDVAFAEGRREEAWEHIERALSLDRANFQALTALVNLAAVDRRLDQARARVEELSAAQPNNAALHYLRGLAYSKFNDTQGPDAARAEEALRRAVQADPDFVAAYSALAALYFNSNQPDRAIAQYGEITRRRPDDFVAIRNIGMIEAQRNNREAAAEYYRRVLSIRPDEPVAANNLAMLYADYGIGNADEAMRVAQDVVRRFPNEAGFADTLGWVYYRRGLHTAAVEQLQRAVAGASKGGRDNSLYRWHLGAALAAKGDKAGARRELQKSLDLIAQEQARSPQQRPISTAPADEVRRTLESL
jgi:tetratricopeptide (TPR) repeat protein